MRAPRHRNYPHKIRTLPIGFGVWVDALRNTRRAEGVRRCGKLRALISRFVPFDGRPSNALLRHSGRSGGTSSSRCRSRESRRASRTRQCRLELRTARSPPCRRCGPNQHRSSPSEGRARTRPCPAKTPSESHPFPSPKPGSRVKVTQKGGSVYRATGRNITREYVCGSTPSANAQACEERSLPRRAPVTERRRFPESGNPRQPPGP